MNDKILNQNDPGALSVPDGLSQQEVPEATWRPDDREELIQKYQAHAIKHRDLLRANLAVIKGDLMRAVVAIGQRGQLDRVERLEDWRSRGVRLPCKFSCQEQRLSPGSEKVDF